MNNKGFTLVEVLAALVVLTIIALVATTYIGNTLSASKEETYNIMKNSIISSSYDYLKECSGKFIECDLVWQDNETTFYAEKLKEEGYFDNLNSPIDNKYLGSCLKINATLDNRTFDVYLVDECY